MGSLIGALDSKVGPTRKWEVCMNRECDGRTKENSSGSSGQEAPEMEREDVGAAEA